MCVQPSAKGRLLVEMVCERVNLLEKDYFSCSYNDEDGVRVNKRSVQRHSD